MATGATLLALVLGTLTSLAVQRHRFFGREAVSFLVVLPIALPGIVTGIALNSAFRQVGIELGLFTLIVAHATFCIVVVYNNTLARLRRLSPHLEEASADLGADRFQTYRFVMFPLVRTALLAGGLLAFGLSFDEIVVTTFTAGAGIETLPQWILNNLSRPNQLPIVERRRHLRRARVDPAGLGGAEADGRGARARRGPLTSLGWRPPWVQS